MSKRKASSSSSSGSSEKKAKTDTKNQIFSAVKAYLLALPAETLACHALVLQVCDDKTSKLAESAKKSRALWFQCAKNLQDASMADLAFLGGRNSRRPSPEELKDLDQQVRESRIQLLQVEKELSAALGSPLGMPEDQSARTIAENLYALPMLPRIQVGDPHTLAPKAKLLFESLDQKSTDIKLLWPTDSLDEKQQSEVLQNLSTWWQDKSKDLNGMVELHRVNKPTVFGATESQLEVRAKVDIPKFTVAVYQSLVATVEEYHKLFPEHVRLLSDRYSHDLTHQVQGLKLIATAYPNYGNATMRINDFRANPWQGTSDDDEIPNCVFAEVVRGNWPYIFVVTTKAIKKGEVLTTDYGVMYWANDKQAMEERRKFVKLLKAVCPSLETEFLGS